MASSSSGADLILLVPDSNTEYTMKGLLARHQAIGIRQIDFNVVRHPERDPGCFLRAPDFLRLFRRDYHHALVLLDREGSGRESRSRLELEEDLEGRLATEWSERSAVVVIDPELEIWLWSDSPEVDAVLGWQGRRPKPALVACRVGVLLPTFRQTGPSEGSGRTSITTCSSSSLFRSVSSVGRASQRTKMSRPGLLKTYENIAKMVLSQRGRIINSATKISRTSVARRRPSKLMATAPNTRLGR